MRVLGRSRGEASTLPLDELIAAGGRTGTVNSMTTDTISNSNQNDPVAPGLRESDSPDRSSSGGAAARLRVVVHDGDGTWFTVPGLLVSALTDAELDELEAGEENLLDTVPAHPLLEYLAEDFTGNVDFSFR